MKQILMSLVIVSIILVGCENTEENKIKELPEDVQVLCQYLGEKPENVIVSENKTKQKENKDDTIYASYIVNVKSNEEKSGYYCVSLHTKGERRYVHIAKEVKVSEREEKDIQWKKSTRLCYDLYEGPVDEVRKQKQEYIVPEIDKSQVKEYEVTRESYLTFTAGSGYLDEDNDYKVAYLGYPSSKWKIKEYSPNGWVKKKVKTSDEIPNTAPEFVHFGADETFWYKDEELLMVTDREGNVIGKLDLNQLKEEQAISDEELTVSYLEDAKVIFSYLTEKHEEKSILVDVKTGNVEKEYDMALVGETFGDKLVKYDQGSDCVEVIYWKTGTVLYQLDLNNIRLLSWEDEERAPLEGKYIAYSEKGKDEIGFHSVYKEELKGYEKISCQPMRFSIYKNQFYIIYESGVYRYDETSETLIQILDGEKTSYFDLMCDVYSVKEENVYADVVVGEDEKIYMLALWGNDEDEFMYLEPKGEDK